MYQKITNERGPVNNVIKRLADNAFIPFDPANTDFQEYQRWLEEGNTPLAADAMTPQENGDTFTLSV